MRIKDILFETTSEDREIIDIASKITVSLKKYVRNKKFGIHPIPLNLFVKPIYKNDTVNELINKLNIEIKLVQDPEHGGLYHEGRNKITIFVDKKSMILHHYIESTLIHELTHAIDDLKSRSEYYSDITGKVKPGKLKSIPGLSPERSEYYSRQAEINARFVEVLGEIKQTMDRLNIKSVNWQDEEDRKKFLRIINFVLEANSLSPDRYFKHGVRDPGYRQLVKRIYKFVTDTEETLAEGDVIDATGKFHTKRMDDLVKSYEKFHKDIEEIEKKLVIELDKIESIPNSILSNQERLMLAPLLKGFKENVPFTSALMWEVLLPEETTSKFPQLAKNFIRLNRDKLIEIVELQLRKLHDLEITFAKEYNESSLSKYKNFAQSRHSLNDLHKFFRTVNV